MPWLPLPLRISSHALKHLILIKITNSLAHNFSLIMHLQHFQNIMNQECSVQPEYKLQQQQQRVSIPAYIKTTGEAVMPHRVFFSIRKLTCFIYYPKFPCNCPDSSHAEDGIFAILVSGSQSLVLCVCLE